MFRFYIDIPLNMTEEEAVAKSQELIQILEAFKSSGIPELGYRLGHDDDRQKSNYLVKTANGHVTQKKCKVSFETPIDNHDE
jgi:hypothetical protein